MHEHAGKYTVYTDTHQSIPKLHNEWKLAVLVNGIGTAYQNVPRHTSEYTQLMEACCAG